MFLPLQKRIISKELLDQFPGRIITAELPKLPRPEIGKFVVGKIFGQQSVFHPVMEERKNDMPLMEIIQRIQRHILENRIRISEYFKVMSILCNFAIPQSKRSSQICSKN